MGLEVRKEVNAIIVKPMLKRIDSVTSLRFKSEIIDLLKDGSKNFLLTLSEVNFIDSSGLGTIIAIHKALNNNQGSLTLCDVQPQVMNLFNITRMNTVFKIFENEKQALQSLTQEKK